MLYEVNGDILRDDYQIICHQTNCKGVMGAGLAKDIALRYPKVYHRNKDYCHTKKALGTILPVQIAPGKTCVNIYGQENYGWEKRCYTNYEALKKALDTLADRINNANVPYESKIAFPKRMGCGLAGGEWAKVRALIEEFSNKVQQDVYIVSFSRKWGDNDDKVNSSAR